MTEQRSDLARESALQYPQCLQRRVIIDTRGDAPVRAGADHVTDEDNLRREEDATPVVAGQGLPGRDCTLQPIALIEEVMGVAEAHRTGELLGAPSGSAPFDQPMSE